MVAQMEELPRGEHHSKRSLSKYSLLNQSGLLSFDVSDGDEKRRSEIFNRRNTIFLHVECVAAFLELLEGKTKSKGLIYLKGKKTYIQNQNLFVSCGKIAGKTSHR